MDRSMNRALNQIILDVDSVQEMVNKVALFAQLIGVTFDEVSVYVSGQFETADKHKDIVFGEHRRFETTNIRRKVFTLHSDDSSYDVRCDPQRTTFRIYLKAKV